MAKLPFDIVRKPFLEITNLLRPHLHKERGVSSTAAIATAKKNRERGGIGHDWQLANEYKTEASQTEVCNLCHSPKVPLETDSPTLIPNNVCSQGLHAQLTQNHNSTTLTDGSDVDSGMLDDHVQSSVNSHERVLSWNSSLATSSKGPSTAAILNDTDIENFAPEDFEEVLESPSTPKQRNSGLWPFQSPSFDNMRPERVYTSHTPFESESAYSTALSGGVSTPSFGKSIRSSPSMEYSPPPSPLDSHFHSTSVSNSAPLTLKQFPSDESLNATNSPTWRGSRFSSPPKFIRTPTQSLAKRDRRRHSSNISPGIRNPSQADPPPPPMKPLQPRTKETSDIVATIRVPAEPSRASDTETDGIRTLPRTKEGLSTKERKVKRQSLPSKFFSAPQKTPSEELQTPEINTDSVRKSLPAYNAGADILPSLVTNLLRAPTPSKSISPAMSRDSTSNGKLAHPRPSSVQFKSNRRNNHSRNENSSSSAPFSSSVISLCTYDLEHLPIPGAVKEQPYKVRPFSFLLPTSFVPQGKGSGQWGDKWGPLERKAEVEADWSTIRKRRASDHQSFIANTIRNSFSKREDSETGTVRNRRWSLRSIKDIRLSPRPPSVDASNESQMKRSLGSPRKGLDIPRPRVSTSRDIPPAFREIVHEKIEEPSIESLVEAEERAHKRRESSFLGLKTRRYRRAQNSSDDRRRRGTWSFVKRQKPQINVVEDIDEWIAVDIVGPERG